ncbi:hypothetical protein TNCV_1825121 [Trichonephila clavipes]|nr:hypothetical protein TNCV_1825121 [Trichonephila clavipes]
MWEKLSQVQLAWGSGSLAEIVEVEIEVVLHLSSLRGVSPSLNRTVTCMVLKANDRRTSCPCHDEFRGPRSDYVRQKNAIMPNQVTQNNDVIAHLPMTSNLFSFDRAEEEYPRYAKLFIERNTCVENLFINFLYKLNQNEKIYSSKPCFYHKIAEIPKLHSLWGNT